MRRALVQGFIILDYAAEFSAGVQEFAPLVLGGRIKHQESIVKGGMDVMVDAVNMLLDGKNRVSFRADLGI